MPGLAVVQMRRGRGVQRGDGGGDLKKFNSKNVQFLNESEFLKYLNLATLKAKISKFYFIIVLFT